MNNILKNDTVGFLRIPNSTFFVNDNIVYKINDLGFRDKNINIKKGKKKRIAFLGDSVTEGFCMDENARFSSIVDTALGENFETMNFAIAGFSTWNSLKVLERYILPLNPDYVFIQVGLNDFERDQYYYQNSYPSLKQQQILKNFFRDNSALYLFVAEKYHFFRLKINLTNRLLDQAIHTESDNIIRTMQNIETMYALCTNNKIPFIVSYFPDESEVLTSNEEWAYHVNDLIEAKCKEKGINYLNVLSFLRKEQVGLFMDNCHLNEKGNIIASYPIIEYFSNVEAGKNSMPQ